MKCICGILPESKEELYEKCKTWCRDEESAKELFEFLSGSPRFQDIPF